MQNLNESPSNIEWSPFSNIDPSSLDIETSWLEYVQDVLKSDIENPCLVSCVVTEFKTKLIKREPHGLVMRNEMRLEYKFEMPFNDDLRSKSPYETVRKEYYIMPLISLVGNVGGALRMFLGFSFFRMCKWIMTVGRQTNTWFKKWF